MIRETWDVLLLVAVLFILLFGGVFYLGRKWERHTITKYLPAAMDGVCEDCEEIGIKEGDKKGYQRGLLTCADVLSNVDEEGGRR
jgi:hypothetical protein